MKNIGLIIQKITGLNKAELFLNPKIDPKFQKEIDSAINRLDSGEPIEYIINNAEFYSLNFYVDNRVLIPRDDTELIVDKAIEYIVQIPKEIEKKQNITLIDIGTGSSCIAISILKNTEKVHNSYVSDISKSALDVSKKNIHKHNLEKKIKQVNGSLLLDIIGINELNLKKNVIITANLPYIKNKDFGNMDKETITYEPDIALYGGKDTGFELYEQLINECIKFKKINNIKFVTLFIEIGFDQKEIAKEFLSSKELKYSIFNDNSEIGRCIKVEFI